ncbi:MAG: carboxylase [Gammaproteobacteria bacterium TMED78]|nr:MAG: carboxylase [Gammaproteobacteria bacterium TMED78]|tara:strand:+ start:66109 stop:67728 length:1620 start_codon:yes stop_codon:yes gene_type:complete
MQKINYSDLRAHLSKLDECGLLIKVDTPINKDTELHPLVRLQFIGGLNESERKAFLFTNIVDSSGRHYDIPVVVGALASNPRIYAIGMGTTEDNIGKTWLNAIANPIDPVIVDNPPCQDLVFMGDELNTEGKGLDRFPVPISTPGYDAAPYLSATLVITKDPETGIQNMGTYRCQLKANDRLGVRMATRKSGAGGYLHFKKYKDLGKNMPCAIVVGAPPAVAYAGPQKLAIDQDELSVAGALAGEPIRVAKAQSQDLNIPADSEIVIEGYIDTNMLEPEGPFGESHGHVAVEDFNMSFYVTAITQKKSPIFPSIISQVTPSESSVIKKVAYEPLYFSYLKHDLSIDSVISVTMHEPLTNIRPVIFIRFDDTASKEDIWKALRAASLLQAQCGKVVIAVSEDIDASNTDAIFWSLAYRSNPVDDLEVTKNRSHGHGPKSNKKSNSSGILIDATKKTALPPLALPKKEYMERAKAIWEELGMPKIELKSPWHGYSLGEWDKKWDTFADNAVNGQWIKNGIDTFSRRRKNLVPETPVKDIEN